MTVEDLIQKLQEYPEYFEVYIDERSELEELEIYQQRERMRIIIKKMHKGRRKKW